jgi:hypothetical protein
MTDSTQLAACRPDFHALPLAISMVQSTSCGAHTYVLIAACIASPTHCQARFSYLKYFVQESSAYKPSVRTMGGLDCTTLFGSVDLHVQLGMEDLRLSGKALSCMRQRVWGLSTII